MYVCIYDMYDIYRKKERNITVKYWKSMMYKEMFTFFQV